jgi:hypothetical protein
MAFISRSNCEHELSGIELNNSSNSSFGSAGDVGGVLNGFDWMDDRDGVDEPFFGVSWASAAAASVELDETGLLSAGDIGGV